VPTGYSSRSCQCQTCKSFFDPVTRCRNSAPVSRQVHSASFAMLNGTQSSCKNPPLMKGRRRSPFEGPGQSCRQALASRSGVLHPHRGPGNSPKFVKNKPSQLACIAGPIRRRGTHGEFSYIGPACCVSFRRKFTGWNAHALKGIADVFG
jgi:hypothetical protein